MQVSYLKTQLIYHFSWYRERERANEQEREREREGESKWKDNLKMFYQLAEAKILR